MAGASPAGVASKSRMTAEGPDGTIHEREEAQEFVRELM
jgi:hypothetical protein